jgi:putative drug exporter of the RND superfamily
VFALIGRFCARHRWPVVAGWLLIVVAGAGASGPVFARLETGQASDRFESIQAYELLGEHGRYGGRVLGLLDGVQVADPAVRDAVLAAAREVAELPRVGRVLEPYSQPHAGLVAADGRALLVVVDLDRDLDGDERGDATEAVGARLRQLPGTLPPALRGGATVLMGGQPLVSREVNEQVRRDTERAELISLPLTLIVMLVVFGGFLAAGLPVLGAIASIAGAFLCLLGFSTVLTLDPNTVPVLTLLGLGLSIDYALLIVSRFREERVAGSGVAAAVERTAATAGRTIAFSALTVAVCLSALFAFDDPTFRAIGAAGVAVVVVALLAGLTLVPALLAIAGRRIRLGRVLPPDQGFFSRLAGAVQRRPWPVAVGVALLLLAAGTPLLSIRLQNSGAALLPASFESVQVEQNVAARFPGIAAEPVTVVARAAPGQLDAYVAGLADRVGPAYRAGVAHAGRAERLGSSAYASVHLLPTGPPQGDQARRLVEQLRQHRADFPTWVGGGAAVVIDFTDEVASSLPVAFAVIAVAAFVLLFLMTGSVLVPVKALVMNTVSLGATFGALVWVFQWGNLEQVLGFTSPGAIETWIPVLVFAFAFGVSMDYEVFLLARIKELYDAGHRNDDAVRLGLQRSGRIITSAALLIVIVFAGFAAGRMVGIKEFGLALAVSIVVDVTLVRCLLVPAAMTLLGDANWWAPEPLRRLHARIGLREGGPAPAVPGGAGLPAVDGRPVRGPRHRAGRPGALRVVRENGRTTLEAVSPAGRHPGGP